MERRKNKPYVRITIIEKNEISVRCCKKKENNRNKILLTEKNKKYKK